MLTLHGGGGHWQPLPQPPPLLFAVRCHPSRLCPPLLPFPNDNGGTQQGALFKQSPVIGAADCHPHCRWHSPRPIAIVCCCTAHLDQGGHVPKQLLCPLAVPPAPTSLPPLPLIDRRRRRLCPLAAFRDSRRTIITTSYSGDSRLIAIINCKSPQDFADRLMRLCINAFGPNGFPRLELAKASGVSSQQHCTWTAVWAGATGRIHCCRRWHLRTINTYREISFCSCLRIIDLLDNTSKSCFVKSLFGKL